jgi:Cu/Ag efflux protein CusF
MLKHISLIITLTAVVFVTPALAQKPVTVADSITESFTIEAIDHAGRIVTLKDKDGLFEELWCGPEVQRFDALKVGDKVTFQYRESLVSAISRPAAGAAAKPAGAAITRAPGGKPGGTIAQQMTVTVTIAAIDAKTPAVTITNDRGQKMSFRVENAKNLEGYKVGDKVEITYTQALAISVTPGK